MKRHGRRTRLGLLVLLVLAVSLAGGALFVKFKLEGLRASVQQKIESRTGMKVRVGSVVVNGLRGLRIEDTAVTLDLAQGPMLYFETPVAYIFVDIVEFLYGRVHIDRIQLDNSLIRVTRPPDRPWIAEDGFASEQDSGLLAIPSFRVLGKDCTLEVLSAADKTRLVVRDFGFDVSRLPDSPDVRAKLAGAFGPERKEARVDIRFATPEDFDFRVQCARLSAEDVRVFLPASDRFIESGVTSPNIRIAGYPGTMLVVGLEAPFENLRVRNQPAFLGSAQGVLTAVANYDLATRLLTLTAAKAETGELAGRIEGSISFRTHAPVFDLRLEATQFPVTDILDYLVQGRADEYATFEVQFQEPSQAAMRLEGTLEAPLISANASIAGGQFSFTPADKRHPEGALELGALLFSWDSETREPRGSFMVTGGALTDGVSGITANNVSGVLTVDNTRVTIDPCNAEITANPFVGSLDYDFATGHGEFTANGVLAEIENTMFRDAVKHLSVKGAVSVRCHGVKTGDRYVFDAGFDATQAEVGYQWWFLKPEGVGASCSNLHVELTPNREASITAEANVATSPIAVTAHMARDKDKWRVQSATATSDALDVVATDTCLRIPYKASGGKGTNARYTWTRDEESPDGWTMTIAGDLDTLALLPEGSAAPLACEGLHVDVTMDKGPQPTGTAALTAKRAQLPRMGTTWFVPLKSDPEVLKAYPPVDWAWTARLAGEAVEVPPWKGSNLEAEAYTDARVTGLPSFEADIEGGGHVSGAYHGIKEENTYETTYTWTDVPASWLLDQLKFPAVLVGTASGEVSYSMDRDDPGTLKGQGNFDIRDGHFSADFLFAKLLEAGSEEGMSALPPSLEFSRFKAGVAFEGDLVKTSDVALVSQGISLTGDGHFITDGDMDYDIKVAISPDVAERIDILRDNFNVQGLRLAQQDIELAFKVHGPTFKPQGRLSEFPSVGVTLVSSALEVTSDAVKVIDIPRKILLDMLRIGGGIMGAAKQ